ncbi:MAG: C-GCAxxG-C-C family protein [Coprobacillaceae bacterium]
MTIKERIDIALEYRKQGYNCAQAIIVAYIDVCPNITLEQAMTISYGFGGGIGGMRETCGCISGAAMVLSLIHGKSESNPKQKMIVNKKITTVTEEFNAMEGSMICGELLTLRETNKPIKRKPCNDYIVDTICILEKYIRKEEVEVSI